MRLEKKSVKQEKKSEIEDTEKETLFFLINSL